MLQLPKSQHKCNFIKIVHCGGFSRSIPVQGILINGIFFKQLTQVVFAADCKIRPWTFLLQY